MDKIIDNGSEGQIGEMPINNSDLLASQNFIKVGNLLYSYDTATKTATLIDGRHRNDNVTIPDTISIGGKLYIVTSIADQAFYGSGITSVTISGRLTKIGRSAFARCEHLIHVSLSANVKIIGDYAFSGCKYLNEVHISDMMAWCFIDFGIDANPLQYGAILIHNFKRITNLIIPDDTQYIKARAFYNYRHITSVSIPDSVRSIGEDAFYQCINLKEVHITNIQAWCNINFGYPGYGDYESNPLIYAHNLFLNNQKITNLVISPGIIQINNGAFCGCSSITNVTFIGSPLNIGHHAFSGCSELTTFNIPNSVGSIGHHAFCNCSKLSKVTIGASVSSIGNFAFYGCNSLNEVHVNSIRTWCEIYFLGEYSNPLEIAHNFYLGESLIRDLVVPEGTTRIAHRAFRNCPLTSASLPGSIDSIGNQAFSACIGLKKLIINNSDKTGASSYHTTSIGEQAFEDCLNMTSVTIGNSVTSIGNSAFSRCYQLQEVHISDIAAWCNIDFGTDSNPLFYARNLYFDTKQGDMINSRLITHLDIPEGVTHIPQGAFRNCTRIGSVTISRSVEAIGARAFQGCTSLDYLNFIKPADSDKQDITIGDSAFEGCNKLKSLTIHNKVTKIGERAFYGCYMIASLTLGNSIKSIGKDAFAGCTAMKQVHISDIKGWCEIDFGENANPLQYGAILFHNLQRITKLIIPDGTQHIKARAFYKYTHITSISIPASVTEIGKDAFGQCDKLEEVHISDIAAWCNIDFKLHKHWKSFANPLRQAHKLYLGDKLIRDLVIPVGVTRINNCAFVECYNLTSITIPDSVTSIGHFAFDGCDLKTLTIPESVDKIGADAFKCYGLTAIYCLRQKPTPINIETFTNYNATVYVPSGFINAYRKDAAWGQFKNIIETSDLPQHVNASSRNTQN